MSKPHLQLNHSQMSVPLSIFSPCPPNVAQSAFLKQPYAQSSTACLWKNPIPLSTQSVVAASLTICLNMNASNAVGKVLDQNSEKLQVRTKEHLVGFHWEEFQAFRTFYLTCSCGWKAPVRVFNDGFNAYFLHNMLETHIQEGVETR
jgi:hypothetical protein